MTIEDRVKPEGKKKLLALDGGGIRGVLALEVLARIEEIVRKKLCNPTAVLADYFDYLAGTSTGAIIATCLSLGMSVDEVRHFYEACGPAMFSRSGMLRRFHHKFEQDRLAAQLKVLFGADTTLGSSRVKTLLMMVLRNATTDSPWLLSNNPAAMFNNAAQPDCNLHLPLWQLVRASTAAPTFFPPEEVQVGNRKFVFVDGGVTMYNNPSFQLFLMATVKPYNLNWQCGVERMLLVSVGTGSTAQANSLAAGDMNLLYHIGATPSALMFAALNEQDFLCRTFGECLAGPPLDLEVGDMRGETGPLATKLFTYLRYSTELSKDGLARLELTGIRHDTIQALDSVDHIPDLERVGRALASRDVRETHFDRF